MSTTPDIDLNTAAVQRLAASPEFAELLADEFIGKDADDTPWLFQGLDSEGRPFRDPEGSGQGVIVISQNDERSQNGHNTWHFPNLQILIYVDSTRNSDGSAITLDARRKCQHIAKRVNKVFHLPSNTEADQDWPGMRVHGSLNSSGLSMEDVPGTQANTVRGTLRYETKVD